MHPKEINLKQLSEEDRKALQDEAAKLGKEYVKVLEEQERRQNGY